MGSRLETNFNRLLSRCENMAGKNNHGDWRLEKYVGALQDQLTELRKAPSRPSQEILTEYTRKVDFLKGLIEAEKLATVSEKALAAELLAPAPQSAENATPSRELHLQAKARYQKELREELLGKSPSKGNASEEGVRQRKVTSDEDLDAVLKHHNEQQEKLAEEMVSLARNLKENAKVASNIVKDDNKKLQQSTQHADVNFSKLKTESDRLETHVRKSCNWWIWIMLIIVCITFIWMVLFMRMFPKR